MSMFGFPPRCTNIYHPCTMYVRYVYSCLHICGVESTSADVRSCEALHEDRRIVHPAFIHLHSQVARHQLRVLATNALAQQREREVGWVGVPLLQSPSYYAHPIVNKLLRELQRFWVREVEHPVGAGDEKDVARADSALASTYPPVVDVGLGRDIRRCL